MASTTQRTQLVASTPARVTHPLYTDLMPIWTKLAHVREGIGGFLDGTYLIAHPREWEDHTAVTPSKPTKKLKARRALACYENIAGMLLEAKKAALFRESATRRVGQGESTGTAKTAVETWWQNVDGKKTHIDDYQKKSWDTAATFGHIAIYMDRPKTPRAVTTRADQVAPILRTYTPLDILDWATDENGEFTDILFQEVAPRPVGTAPSASSAFRTRRVTREYWELFDHSGQTIDRGQHQFGTLPVVMLYAQRRPLLETIGQSVLGDPQLYIDLYNLLSELRELLRSQTFSLLNIPLGTGPDAMSVDDAAKLIGGKTGTDNVLFSGLAAGFISADAANVQVYQQEIDRRLRTVFRITGLVWETDSLEAEATGSRRLKREDMNQRLAAYGDELEKVDYKLVELFYRATLGADAWEAQLEKEPVTIRYPDNFDVTPFAQVLEEAQAAIAISMPAEFLKELRKRLVPKFLPDLPAETLQDINDAIDSAPDDLTPAEQTRQRIEATLSTLNGKPDTTLSGGKPAPARRKRIERDASGRAAALVDEPAA